MNLKSTGKTIIWLAVVGVAGYTAVKGYGMYKSKITQEEADEVAQQILGLERGVTGAPDQKELLALTKKLNDAGYHYNEEGKDSKAVKMTIKERIKYETIGL